MAWGQGSGWGVDAVWGTIPQAPILNAVDKLVADERGGTLITLFGAYFQDPMTIDFLDPNVDTVVGKGYYSNARYDLTPTSVVIGTPALPAGFYRIRVTTVSGTSGTLTEFRTKAYADEAKVVRMRSKWASVWETGRRYLMGG